MSAAMDRLATTSLRFANTRVSPEGRQRTVAGWPVAGLVTQLFGVTSVTGSRHGGVDIAAQEGTPIRAPAAGLLRRHSLAERAWEFGNWVAVDHPGTPWYSAYAHLSAFEAAEGPVEAGAIVGYAGATGVAFGAHLHWALGTDPWFGLDFTKLADPLGFAAGGSMELEARLERLERILAGNGLRAVAEDGTERLLTGDDALAWADGRGHSLHLGLALLADRVAALEATKLESAGR